MYICICICRCVLCILMCLVALITSTLCISHISIYIYMCRCTRLGLSEPPPALNHFLCPGHLVQVRCEGNIFGKGSKVQSFGWSSDSSDSDPHRGQSLLQSRQQARKMLHSTRHEDEDWWLRHHDRSNQRPDPCFSHLVGFGPNSFIHPTNRACTPPTVMYPH